MATRARSGARTIRAAAAPSLAATAPRGDERKVVSGHSISFVPAGASTITLLGAAKVVRMVTTRSEDLAKLCSNAASYATPHPNLPPFEPWPEATGGAKIRTYSLDVAATPGRDFDPLAGHRFMRFSYAGSHDEMIESMDRLERWLR